MKVVRNNIARLAETHVHDCNRLVKFELEGDLPVYDGQGDGHNETVSVYFNKKLGGYVQEVEFETATLDGAKIAEYYEKYGGEIEWSDPIPYTGLMIEGFAHRVHYNMENATTATIDNDEYIYPEMDISYSTPPVAHKYYVSNVPSISDWLDKQSDH